MTDDEWAAIERPIRLVILEHCGMTTKQVNIRLPHSSHELMTELQDHLGMTQVQVIIVALEHLALVKNITPPKGKPRKENTEMSYNAGITARIQSTDWDYLRSYTDEQIAAILNRLGGSQQERAEYTAAIAVAASRQIDSLITNRKAKAMITVTRQSWIDNDDDDALA